MLRDSVFIDTSFDLTVLVFPNLEVAFILVTASASSAIVDNHCASTAMNAKR